MHMATCYCLNSCTDCNAVFVVLMYHSHGCKGCASHIVYGCASCTSWLYCLYMVEKVVLVHWLCCLYIIYCMVVKVDVCWLHWLYSLMVVKFVLVEMVVLLVYYMVVKVMLVALL